MTNFTDVLKAAAIILAAVAVWWPLAVAIDWLRDWLQALNIRKHQYAGRHVSPGGEPLPVLGGQQGQSSWWPWGSIRRDDEFDGDHRDGLDVIEAVEAANQDVPGSGHGAQRDAATPSVEVHETARPGYFHDDVPTDVVPAVQMTDGTYIGLKGTIPADLPRPGSEDNWVYPAGPGQPDDTTFVTPSPRAGRPVWAPPPPQHPAWVQRILDAPITEVRRALQAPDPDMYLWNWAQRRALEMAT
jgi:hypothetical protein